MKKVIITGCNGQLGLELQEKLRGKYEILPTNRESVYITNFNGTVKYIKACHPDVIINCAAFTAVDICEEKEEEAYLVNAVGPKNLSFAANIVNAKLIHISTDYVFDGEGIINGNSIRRPYYESDKPNPQSSYGRTKLAGEEYVINNCNKYIIIRTAWLYGKGSNFVNTMINLSKINEEVRVVNDQIGSPTSTEELANMIEKLIETEECGIYHGTCEGYCSWYDFASEIYRMMSINIKVIPVSTEEFARKAKRPKYSVLENKKLKEHGFYSFKNWQEALRIYLNKYYINEQEVKQ